MKFLPCRNLMPIHCSQNLSRRITSIGYSKKTEGPIQSHQLFKKKVFPALQNDRPTFFFLIDNLRYDQWKMINDVMTDYYRLEEEDAYYSILPTATQYARNAIFSGLTP